MDDSSDSEDFAWRRLWRIVDDPSPGIAVAMPWEVWVPEAPGTIVEPYLNDAEKYQVTWLGWDPSVGLMKGESLPVSSRNKVLPHIETWVPFASWNSAHRTKSLTNEDFEFVELGCLPFPVRVAQRTLETTVAVALERATLLKYSLFTEFTELLPNNVSVCCSVLGVSSLSTLDYLLGASASGGIGISDARDRRCQFVMVHSWVIASQLCADPVVRECVDRAQELTPVLARLIGTQERVVRFIGGAPKKTQVAASSFLFTPCCLSLLEGMDPAWLPVLRTASRDVWGSLCALSWELPHERQRRRTMFGSPKDLPFQRLAYHLGSTFVPEKDIGFSWFADSEKTWVHFHDTVRDMACELVLPALARDDGNAEMRKVHFIAMKSALCALGVRRLLRCLEDHLAGVVHDARLGWSIPEGSADDGWGEAAPEAVSPQGLTLRFLRSQGELRAEGSALGHCVATYGQSCAKRNCAILSVGRWIQDRRWMPSSTAEIRLERDGHPFVSQHYGEGNGYPEKENRDALAWWLEQVQGGNIVLVPEAIRYAPRGNPSARDLPLLLGAAWNTPEAHAHRWDRWRRLLRTRHATCGDWLMSLPPVYVSSYPDNAGIRRLVVDLDAAMAAL